MDSPTEGIGPSPYHAYEIPRRLRKFYLMKPKRKAGRGKKHSS